MFEAKPYQRIEGQIQIEKDKEIKRKYKTRKNHQNLCKLCYIIYTMMNVSKSIYANRSRLHSTGFRSFISAIIIIAPALVTRQLYLSITLFLVFFLQLSLPLSFFFVLFCNNYYFL